MHVHPPSSDTLLLTLLRRLSVAIMACYWMLAINGCFLWPESGSPAEGAEETEESANDQEEDSNEDSSSSDDDEEAKEIKSEDSAKLTDEPEAELVQTSKRVYQAKAYSAAQDSLVSLRDRYPLGAYGQWAAIKAADAFYYNSAMDKAAAAYEEFLKNFPGSVDTPYVKLQAARAHFASAQGIGRDRQPLERSLLLYDELEADYSHTPYGVAARSERTPVLDELTAYDQFIIDFYQRTGNPDAVKARQQMFKERWGSRMNAGEFKNISEEIPLEPLPQADLVTQANEAQAEAAVVAHEREAEPAEIIEEEISVVEGVQCDSSKIPYAVVQLSSFPAEYEPGSVIEELHPSNGVVEVPYLAARSGQPSYDCFGQGDLFVSQGGRISLRTSSSVILTTRATPSRIVLTVVQR